VRLRSVGERHHLRYADTQDALSQQMIDQLSRLREVGTEALEITKPRRLISRV
jgi:hypothetical protein